MIDRILVNNYIRQSWLLFASCGAALFAFAWVRVWVVSLLDMGQFQTILEQFREFEKFAPIEFDALYTYAGRVGMTYDEPIVILCIVIWCISRGSDVVSGEIGRGTMEMILSQPITRQQLMMSQAVVSLGGLALLCLTTWAGLGVGVSCTSVDESLPPTTFHIPWVDVEIPLSGDTGQQTIPLSDRVDVASYAASTFQLFAFGSFVLGLATLLSSFDRYRWRTVGMTVAFYIIQGIMFGLGKAADSLSWLLSWTFFSCYRPQKMAQMANRDGLAAPWGLTENLVDGSLPPLAYSLVLLGFSGVFFVVALTIFTRRDLPAPL